MNRTIFGHPTVQKESRFGIYVGAGLMLWIHERDPVFFFECGPIVGASRHTVEEAVADAECMLMQLFNHLGYITQGGRSL